MVKSCVRCQAIDPDLSEHNPFSLVKLELDKVGHQHNSLLWWDILNNGWLWTWTTYSMEGVVSGDSGCSFRRA